MNKEYISRNHWKGLIQYHIIFVCKYRRKVFQNQKVSNSLKSIMLNIASKYDFTIEIQEIDPLKPDHWHCLVSSIPTLSPMQIVHVLKQQSTFELWKLYPKYLSSFYWKNHELWTSGYFCSSIGNASNETVQKYIEEQG